MKKLLPFAFIAVAFSCSKPAIDPDYDKAVAELPGVYISAYHYLESGYGRVASLKKDGSAEFYYFFDENLKNGVSIDTSYVMTGSWKPLKVNENMDDNVKSNIAVCIEMNLEDSPEVYTDTCYTFVQENRSRCRSTFFGDDEFFKVNLSYDSFINELKSFLPVHLVDVGAPQMPTNANYPSHGSNWMSSLPDDIYIRDMSIPGTHDSFSYRCTSSAQCQTIDATEQFKFGVRYFDCRYYRAWWLFRWQVYPCHDNMGICLNLCKNICTDLEKIENCVKNSRECAIIMLKHDRDKQAEWRGLCREWLEKNAINKSIYIPFRKDMKLGEARGKIILMYRGSEWSGKAGYEPFGYIQDDYVFDETTKDWSGKKAAAFQKCVDYRKVISPKGKTGSYNDEWAINHCSGYLRTFQPVIFTHYTYPKILNVMENTPNKTFGVVPMDYVGRDGYVRESLKLTKYEVHTPPLVECLIKSNDLLK